MSYRQNARFYTSSKTCPLVLMSQSQQVAQWILGQPSQAQSGGASPLPLAWFQARPACHGPFFVPIRQ